MGLNKANNKYEAKESCHLKLCICVIVTNALSIFKNVRKNDITVNLKQTKKCVCTR